MNLQFNMAAERSRSAARDLELSIRTDFIASPLHRFVRLFAALPSTMFLELL
jgi:hypothetical protein